MAESVVSFVVEKLGNLPIEEAVFLYGVVDEVEWVKTELKRMQCSLIDAEEKGRNGDERVRNWVREVRDVAYQVENVIDNVMYMARRRRLRGFIGCISRYAHIPEELILLHKIGTEIEVIKNKIRELSDSRQSYGIANLGESADEVTGNIDDTLQFDVDRDVVGFEDATKALIKQLLDLNNARRCVISIVGMGGLGKTTLASRIYNSSDIKRHFSILVWLTVSQYYSTNELSNDIHEKVTGNRTDKGEEYLRTKIYEFLKEERYLIVLDDVCGNFVWDKIHEVFPDKNNGSRVMLTARNKDVTLFSDPITLHELRLLNNEESWELLCKKTFPGNPNRQTRCPEELEDLSRRIARDCGGLPLALVVLGGLLSTKVRTCPVWLNVTGSMVRTTTLRGPKLSSILALSYNDLPHHLKSCFIYIGAFPGNRDISVSLLIRLWIAEGFISQTTSQTLEETARGYLDELVKRCMVQVTAKSLAHGWAKRIHIHDMLRDLCISEAKTDGIMNIYCSYRYISSSSSSAMAARCLAVHSIGEHPIFPTDLHSLLLFVAVDLSSFLTKLKRLRVLHQQGWIGPTVNLRRSQHLRYLRLPKFLPTESCCPSIKNLLPTLYNLITLDVGCWVQVHGIIWESPTLRHLYIREDPISPPAKFSFWNLQVLWRVRAGEWIDRSLANHTNLRKLGISYISASHHEKLITSLQKLDHLVTLQLHSNQSIPTEVLTIFQNQHHLHVLKLYGEFSKGPQLPPSSGFPPGLTKLLLSDCKLEHDPMPTLEKLPNLIYLHLDGEAYVGKNMSCSERGFTRLLKLMLVGLFNMEDWSITRGAMPKLTQLSINWCHNLTTLPHGLQHVTSLQELQLSNMPEEFIDRVDKKHGEDWNKIQHVPSIIIRGVLRED